MCATNLGGYRPHLRQNGHILEVILYQAQERAKITENILIAAVKNRTHSARYVRVEWLFKQVYHLNIQTIECLVLRTGCCGLCN